MSRRQITYLEGHGLTMRVLASSCTKAEGIPIFNPYQQIARAIGFIFVIRCVGSK